MYVPTLHLLYYVVQYKMYIQDGRRANGKLIKSLRRVIHDNRCILLYYSLSLIRKWHYAFILCRKIFEFTHSRTNCTYIY